jgi:hypothetical protein
MGMDLIGAGGYFRWTNVGWYDILELAKELGWTPTGTGPPPKVLKKDWRPPRRVREAEWLVASYYGDHGQRFYARDATALADALDRAVAKIADRGGQKSIVSPGEQTNSRRNSPG